MKTAEYYVFLFVDHYANAALNDELVVLGPHLNGLLVDFMGEIPASGNFKRDSVGWRADRLRRVSKDFAKAAALIGLCTHKQRQALCEWAYYKDRWPEGSDRRLTNKDSVARYLHVDAVAWFELIQRGEDRINAALGIFVA